jgi:hypothetical protein
VLQITEQPSQRLLSASDGQTLTALILQMADRYPSQDLTDSLEGYLWDFQQLALRYSLPKVTAALAELRLRPGQSFFPRPDEVAGEIERQQDVRNRAADTARQAQRRADDIAWFWKIALERLEEYGEFRYNGATYRSVDEVSQAPGSYRGTKPEGL